MRNSHIGLNFTWISCIDNLIRYNSQLTSWSLLVSCGTERCCRDWICWGYGKDPSNNGCFANQWMCISKYHDAYCHKSNNPVLLYLQDKVKIFNHVSEILMFIISFNCIFIIPVKGFAQCLRVFNTTVNCLCIKNQFITFWKPGGLVDASFVRQVIKCKVTWQLLRYLGTVQLGFA